MRITVKVKANAKKESVREIGPNELEVRVHAPPVDGKANERLIEILAEYFQVPRSRVNFLSGEKSKIKRFEIL